MSKALIKHASVPAEPAKRQHRRLHRRNPDPLPRERRGLVRVVGGQPLPRVHGGADGVRDAGPVAGGRGDLPDALRRRAASTDAPYGIPECRGVVRRYAPNPRTRKHVPHSCLGPVRVAVFVRPENFVSVRAKIVCVSVQHGPERTASAPVCRGTSKPSPRRRAKTRPPHAPRRPQSSAGLVRTRPHTALCFPAVLAAFRRPTICQLSFLNTAMFS